MKGRPFAVDLAFAGIGAAVQLSRNARALAATMLQTAITLGTGASLILQRYVAEVDDSQRWR